MKYVALLRAVNVGGRFMKMDDLKKCCASLQLKNVETYLQSGNVIFESSASVMALQKKFEAKLRDSFKYDISVLVKQPKDFQKVIKQNPFKNTEGLYVTLLFEKPSKEAVLNFAEAFKKAATPDEDYVLKGDVLYLSCPKGYGKSKLNNGFVEKKLGVTATTRNWNTIQALAGSQKCCAVSPRRRNAALIRP